MYVWKWRKKVESFDGYGNFMNTTREMVPIIYFSHELSGSLNLLATKIG